MSATDPIVGDSLAVGDDGDGTICPLSVNCNQEEEQEEEMRQKRESPKNAYLLSLVLISICCYSDSRSSVRPTIGTLSKSNQGAICTLLSNRKVNISMRTATLFNHPK